eukprot:scaffold2705_cov109-Isochrysis_galbana.AAC.18
MLYESKADGSLAAHATQTNLRIVRDNSPQVVHGHSHVSPVLSPFPRHEGRRGWPHPTPPHSLDVRACHPIPSPHAPSSPALGVGLWGICFLLSRSRRPHTEARDGARTRAAYLGPAGTASSPLLPPTPISRASRCTTTTRSAGRSTAATTSRRARRRSSSRTTAS